MDTFRNEGKRMQHPVLAQGNRTSSAVAEGRGVLLFREQGSSAWFSLASDHFRWSEIMKLSFWGRMLSFDMDY